MKINSISASDPLFPEKLRTIPNPPTRLFYLGNPAFDPAQKIVAIVGSRKVTTYGRNITTALSEGLTKRGVLVVSGLALGVDGIAHQGALTVGGRTVAVLASGLETITPFSHRELARKILDTGGAIFSEYEPEIPPLPFRFLERNRLVIGLADALIITEATTRSGTMNTAVHALEQGKDVYVVPGNITSPMSGGCNKLIAQGAAPIVNVETFLEDFAPTSTQPKQQLLLAQTAEEQAVIDLIQSGVTDGEELQKKSKLDPQVFSRTLTMLELRGVIRALGAHSWSL